MEAKPQPLGYTVAQAVKATGIGRTTIYADMKTGRLAARKRGKRTIILADDLKSYLASLPLKEAAFGGIPRLEATSTARRNRP